MPNQATSPSLAAFPAREVRTIVVEPMLALCRSGSDQIIVMTALSFIFIAGDLEG